MPDFDKPSLTTAQGTRALIAATPDGLMVRTRDVNGAESGGCIPADVAIALLDNAEQLRIAMTKAPSDG